MFPFQMLTRTNIENISFTCPGGASKRKKKQRKISKRGKTLVTAGNMFLMVMHSQQQGRQMPLVKQSYLFCPWKQLKNNKSILNKEQHDLMLLPVFLPSAVTVLLRNGGTTGTHHTQKATQQARSTQRELFNCKAGEETLLS